jgi:hypothetical protein
MSRMTYMRSWKSLRLTSHTWLGLNPQIGRPLSRIVVPLVFFFFFLATIPHARVWFSHHACDFDTLLVIWTKSARLWYEGYVFVTPFSFLLFWTFNSSVFLCTVKKNYIIALVWSVEVLPDYARILFNPKY